MLLGVLTGPDSVDVRRQIEKGHPYVDGFEWRLDLFSKEALASLAALKQASPKPSLFTWRSSSLNVEAYLPLAPDYCDLESTCSKEFVEELTERFPKTRFVISFHDFDSTPSDLDALLNGLRQLPAYAYKIAVKSQSTNDTLRLLSFIKRTGSRVSGIPMGSIGQPGRVLGPIVGNYFDFAYIEEHPTLQAAGLLSAEELQKTYRYHSLGHFTSIYALLGDPVDKSISHQTHNAFFQEKGYNAVYVKLPLKQEELAEFFSLVAELPFQGFSVTMPLKEAIIPFAAHLDKTVEMSRALNTLVRREGRWIGMNTDGPAAVDLLEQQVPISGKHCIVLGAGGAARAIAYVLLQRGARVTLVNRSLEKAQSFTKSCGGEAYPLTEFERIINLGYDILIQATSVGFHNQNDSLVQAHHIHPGKLLFEVVSKATSFVSLAQAKKCPIILGQEHFRLQATLQFQNWF